MEIRRVTSSSSPQSLPLRCKKQPCHYSLKKPPTPLRHPSSPNIHIPLPKLHNIQFPSPPLWISPVVWERPAQCI